MQKERIWKIFYTAWQKTREALTSPWIRRHRSWLFQAYVLFALVAFAALAFIANTTPYMAVDLQFTLELQENMPAWLGLLLQAVSWPGYAVQGVSIVALVVVFLGVIGLRWEALAAVFAALAAASINYLIKIAIQRPRPPEDLVDVFQTLTSYSFPSGHVMFYTSFFGFLLYLAYTMLRRSIIRLLLMILLAGLVLLVGLSRMYLGEHWATDVVAGYLLGSLLLILSIQLYQWGRERFVIDQPILIPDDYDFNTTIPVTSDEADEDEHNPDRPRPK